MSCMQILHVLEKECSRIRMNKRANERKKLNFYRKFSWKLVKIGEYSKQICIQINALKTTNVWKAENKCQARKFTRWGFSEDKDRHTMEERERQIYGKRDPFSGQRATEKWKRNGKMLVCVMIAIKMNYGCYSACNEIG